MANKYCKFVVDSARKNLAPADAYEATKQIFKNHKATKNIKFLKHIMIAIPMYLGCGAIVDYFNKKQRAESEPNAVTEKGNEYKKIWVKN